MRAFHGSSSERITEPFDIGVCTIEKANMIINLLIEENQLQRLSMIVIDELHLFVEPSRGYILELLLAKLRFLDSRPRPIMSAGRGDVESRSHKNDREQAKIGGLATSQDDEGSSKGGALVPGAPPPDVGASAAGAGVLHAIGDDAVLPAVGDDDDPSIFIPPTPPVLEQAPTSRTLDSSKIRT